MAGKLPVIFMYKVLECGVLGLVFRCKFFS